MTTEKSELFVCCARDPREPPIIGTCQFADGLTRYVYEDSQAGQFVFGDDGEPVYGVWVHPDEAPDSRPSLTWGCVERCAVTPEDKVCTSVWPVHGRLHWIVRSGLPVSDNTVACDLILHIYSASVASWRFIFLYGIREHDS